MNASTFLIAFEGGFFGVLASLVVGFLVLRAWARHAMGPKGPIGYLIKDAHAKNKCPVCERPMQHEAAAP